MVVVNILSLILYIYIVGGIISIFLMFFYFIPQVKHLYKNDFDFYKEITSKYKNNNIINIVENKATYINYFHVIKSSFFTSWISAIAIIMFSYYYTQAFKDE